MPTIADQTSVAANSTSPNVLAGELHEFPHGPAAISLLCTTTATGVYAHLSAGGRVIVDRALVSRANRYPLKPDDALALAEAVMAGERIILKFENTTAGALVVDHVLEVVYL